MINAKHPANSPPPKMVSAKLKNASALLVGCVSYKRSRTPPCTIRTASVVNDPMPAHHKNVLISAHSHSNVRTARRVATVAERLYPVKERGEPAPSIRRCRCVTWKDRESGAQEDAGVERGA